ncbi:hypothetical protein [Microbacterium sp. PM5]|uniref:hypothetical protein n=1 Tax=Microbacterium sp. PM5 TaxID=2014534 RepID=UPI000DD182CF|nr:hypothetical protein [Microbacterium sp. PM5]AXA95446.1 hypothetical protein CEP17_02880 [Microbacterium sp. PM5]
MIDPFFEDETEWLTYREAAKKIGRTKRCIEYWRARGMVMDWAIRDGQRVRVVQLGVLRAWWRERMKNDPTQPYRIRREIARQEAAQHRSEQFLESG